jgi:5'-nucleotidase
MTNILITNPPSLEEKKAIFKKAGLSSIHILSDFDRTLTNAFTNKKKTPSIISHLRNGNYLNKEYSGKAHELFNKYHPIELSQSINQEEKNRAMTEWWSSHYKLLAESGLDKKTVEKATIDCINEKSIELRTGCKEFLETTNKANIPLIVISSSGIGNMIIEFLKQQNLFLQNFHFIGNTLEFNEEGKFIGIKDNKIIHSFNKNEVELENLPIYQEIKNRKNIILLGDSLGDLEMVEGTEYDNIIKIGFYNYPEEESLEEYQRNFDIIIKDDGDFSYINQLLKDILE